MTKVSVNLKVFFRDYLAWVEAGTPLHYAFSTALGLCNNVDSYDYAICEASGKKVGLLSELEMLFRTEGLHRHYPFNNRNRYGTYDKESDARTMHLNPRRIAFVKKYAGLT